MCKHIYNTEINYPKGTPFTYQLSWTNLDIHYYGVRYSKYCHPDDLWTKYFTSSKYVNTFKIENGEPDIIKVDYIFDTKEEAREYEYQYIKENNCVKDPKWLNLGNGGEDFFNLGGNKISEEQKQKIGNFNRGRIHTEESKQKMSDSHKKNIRKKRKPYTEIAKQRISDANKRKIGINNGINEKYIKPEFLQEYLDLGWILGRLPRSTEHQKKIAESNKDKFHITNGIIDLFVTSEEAEIIYSFGFIYGTLYKINNSRKNKKPFNIKNNLQNLFKKE